MVIGTSLIGNEYSIPFLSFLRNKMHMYLPEVNVRKTVIFEGHIFILTVKYSTFRRKFYLESDLCIILSLK